MSCNINIVYLLCINYRKGSLLQSPIVSSGHHCWPLLFYSLPTSLLQQSFVSSVPHCKVLHWYSLLSGQEFQILTKIWLHFWQHIMIDVWHLPSVYVACNGLSDLGNGPNKPTATIICECSASLQGAALVVTLVRVRISDLSHPMLSLHYIRETLAQQLNKSVHLLMGNITHRMYWVNIGPTLIFGRYSGHCCSWGEVYSRNIETMWYIWIHLDGRGVTSDKHTVSKIRISYIIRIYAMKLLLYA